MADAAFVELFGCDTDVVFAFHGYQRAIHELLHRRREPERFHVRGYRGGHHDDALRHGHTERDEPLSSRDRGARRAPRMQERARALIEECHAILQKQHAYTRTNFEDLPEIRDWMWAV